MFRNLVAIGFFLWSFQVCLAQSASHKIYTYKLVSIATSQHNDPTYPYQITLESENPGWDHQKWHTYQLSAKGLLALQKYLKRETKSEDQWNNLNAATFESRLDPKYPIYALQDLLFRNSTETVHFTAYSEDTPYLYKMTQVLEKDDPTYDQGCRVFVLFGQERPSVQAFSKSCSDLIPLKIIHGIADWADFHGSEVFIAEGAPTQFYSYANDVFDAFDDYVNQAQALLKDFASP
ncbi:MAG: hypothetical protein R3A45_02245 [Bdellovibrionota bacterium]